MSTVSSFHGHANGTMDPYISTGRLMCIAGSSCYLIYHWTEPLRPLVHLCLLVLTPVSLICLSSGASTSVVHQGGYILLYWTILAVLTIAYRISPIHPLAKIPGPIAGKVSKFYMAYLYTRGDAHRILREMHQKCGDTIRIGPNELSFNTSEAIRPIYAEKTMPRGPYYFTRINHLEEAELDGLFDFAVHTHRRKPWNRAMSVTAIKNYEPLVRTQVEEMIGGLCKYSGEEVDISKWMSFFGYDMMGRFAFGREFGMTKIGEDENDLLHSLESGLWLTGIISHISWVVPFLRLLAGSKTVGKVASTSREYAIRRLEHGSGHKDLYYYLMNEDGSGKSELSRGDAIADGNLAVIAGSDTTSTTLSHLWYFLLTNPACAKHLQLEIDAAYPDINKPTSFSHLGSQDMPYLNACINEALRLLPPVLGGLQRQVDYGSGGVMLGGHFVPEGTKVSAHTYTIQRDPRNFSPLPDTFWPDRWLEQENYTLPNGQVVSKAEITTNYQAFIPFSVGPQHCAGKAFAMAELRLVLCEMLRHFEMKIPKGRSLDKWETSLQDIYTTARGPLYVVLTPRK